MKKYYVTQWSFIVSNNFEIDDVWTIIVIYPKIKLFIRNNVRQYEVTIVTIYFLSYDNGTNVIFDEK